MLKRLMITTAAAALASSVAFAQAPSPPAGSQAQPQAQTTSPAGSATKQVITEQKPDQLLATKFKGTDVIGADNQKIGDVSDILFDKDGKVLAYVIGVGGFLGIGAKDVALAPASFQVQPATDRENMKLKLSMTKDELKQAAEFKVYRAPTPTTGQAPGGAPSRDRAPMTPPAQRQ